MRHLMTLRSHQKRPERDGGRVLHEAPGSVRRSRSSWPAVRAGPRRRQPDAKSVVVTYSVLGSVVKDLVGDAATVTVLMPNGADPHEWSPSAQDIETMTKADLLVENGLEPRGRHGRRVHPGREGRGQALHRLGSHHRPARRPRVEGIDTSDPDQAVGAEDPHLWMDPLTMKDVVAALATQMQDRPGDRRLGSGDRPRGPTHDAQRPGRRHREHGPRRRSARWSPATSRWATSRSATATSWSVPSSRA